MPYTLLYSRNITSDAVMRVLDVPIPDRNVMIEVLSLLSPFRRLAGYAYALRSDGITDYERSSPHTLPFGKNRIYFGDAVPPYFLEFFPRFGVKTGIISVYTGEPSPPGPPPGSWIPVTAHNIEFRRATNPSRLEYRQPIGSSVIQSMASGFVEGGYFDGYLNWKTEAFTYKYTSITDLSFEGLTSETYQNQLMTNPAAILF